jgi:hypothetical protein
MARPVADYSGRKIGMLTVLEIAERPKGKNVIWRCRCECGNETLANSGKLTRPYLISCGCFQKVARISHGETRGRKPTGAYVSWSQMLARCTNPKNPSFDYYGGRGITVCRRWRLSFEAFLADMGARPAGHSIDRLDSNGNYEPGNCRWATKTRQARNHTDNRTATLNGETLCASEWAERTGIPASAIVKRLRRGWSDERALTTPPQR